MPVDRMRADRVQTGLRLEEKTLSKITAIARLEKRSLNAQIEIAVEQLIRRYEAAHGPIEVQDESADPLI